VCARPLAAVVGALALDHTALLGASLAAIAREKGGVFKAGCPAVFPARLPPDAEQALLTAARAAGASPVLRAPPAELLRPCGGLPGTPPARVRCCGVEADLALPGGFQAEPPPLPLPPVLTGHVSSLLPY